MLELFNGTGNLAAAFRALGWETVTLDAEVAGLPTEAFDTYEYADTRRSRVKTVLTWEWRPARRSARATGVA